MGGAPSGEASYLEPVGNFEVDLVDALDAVVERLRGLAGLQMGLVQVSAVCRAGLDDAHQHAGILGPGQVVHGDSKEMMRNKGCVWTSRVRRA